MLDRNLDTNAGHPCFDEDAKGKVGRVHLPVAPRCNIQCLFCNRQEDCVLESRPGVTSHVLAPADAVERVAQAKRLDPRIGVVGITGPGDPLANLEAVLETCQRVVEVFPEMELCLATNGLGLTPQVVDRLVSVGIRHVSVGVSAVDPDIGQMLVGRVRDERVLFGRDGVELLIQRQLDGIRLLKERGVVVKVNTVVVEGVNDHHVPAVAHAVAMAGADLHNCIALSPAKGTPLAVLGRTPKEVMDRVRAEAGNYLPQMTHCAACRSDSVGMIGGADRWAELAPTHRRPDADEDTDAPRPYVAVASLAGEFVDQHLGVAAEFAIWEKMGDSFRLVEKRPTDPNRDDGRWDRLAVMLSDCRAVVVSGAGESPRRKLAAAGIALMERTGAVAAMVEEVFATTEKKAKALVPTGGGGCGGPGTGKGKKRLANGDRPGEGGC